MLFFCFLHRLSGGRELPQACSSLTGGSFFQHRLSGERELPQAGSPLTGGGFSLNLSGGIRRAPRRGKRVDTKVSTLLTPTSFYFLVWRRPETGDRFENRGTAVGLPQHVFLRLFAVHRQRTATHTVKSTQARHIRVAQLVSLEIMDGTYESIYLVAFIFAETVRNNALTNRAALLCRTLRRVNRLCSRTVSDPANRLRKTRKKKSSAVPYFRSGHI